MLIEIVDDGGGQTVVLAFPPAENHVDLRQNPQAIERIEPARRHLPLRNFLTLLNGAESAFATATAAIESNSSPTSPTSEMYEFGSWVSLVFAEPSLNFDVGRYKELAAGLKTLLERDPGDSVRGVLRISSCDFLDQNRRGFCLGIELVACRDSAQQAELRWGLGLARVQQALLFRARSLGQQIGA